jgi:hypothetical protein
VIDDAGSRRCSTASVEELGPREEPASAENRAPELGYRRGGQVRIVVARVTHKAKADDETSSSGRKPKEWLRPGLLAPP